jgi:threonylcarbamoyladenosine tRNA methylthiotransferase MtaB
MFSVAIHTLGCKLNQLESESIAESFRREGFSVSSGDLPESSGDASILVINTCTVTSKAEQKARRIIRKALRDYPRSCVIVTGCYAQLEREAIAALDTGAGDRRLFVLSGDRKSILLDIPRLLHGEWYSGASALGAAGLSLPELSGFLKNLLENNTRTPAAAASVSPLPPVPALSGAESPSRTFRFNAADFSFHSRALLKIQDGCDKRCSYCRVTLARGPSVSLDAETVLSRLQELEAGNYGEAVLTGVNINQYRSGALDLGGLLEYLLGNTRTIALRLSSLEPEDMTDSFFRALGDRRIRPHFHLSVQSGSSLILERMRRTYRAEDVENAIRRLRALRGDPFLACDIITGFPGETPEEFEKTYALCRRVGFAWIHAFPYSRRPGTEAFSFTEPVAERESVKRVESLIALARQGRADYIRRWTGKTVDAVVEDAAGGRGLPDAVSPRTMAAVSENYLKLMLPLPEGVAPLPPGSVLRCRIQKPADPPDPHVDALAEPVKNDTDPI